MAAPPVVERVACVEDAAGVIGDPVEVTPVVGESRRGDLDVPRAHRRLDRSDEARVAYGRALELAQEGL